MSYNYEPYDRPDIRRAREQNQRAMDQVRQQGAAATPMTPAPFNGVTTGHAGDMVRSMQAEADEKHARSVRGLAETAAMLGAWSLYSSHRQRQRRDQVISWRASLKVEDRVRIAGETDLGTIVGFGRALPEGLRVRKANGHEIWVNWDQISPIGTPLGAGSSLTGDGHLTSTGYVVLGLVIGAVLILALWTVL